MLRVGVFGATGRVGRLVVEILNRDPKAQVESVFVRNNLDFSLHPSTLVTNDYDTFLNSSDVIIDFSLPDATLKLLRSALSGNPKPIVIGTTGLEDDHFNLIKDASIKMPILYSTNMSLGIALLNRVVALASEALSDFDIEMLEMHHKFKKDSPSGTALTLAQSAAQARGLDIQKCRISGRCGNIGERSEDEIGVMALRGGDIVGKHTVGFYGDGEFLEFTHTATSRDTFAHGAIKAAKWLVNQKSGHYSISDSLGI